MRGDDLLLAHLGFGDAEPKPERPSARERLDEELGPELAERLVGVLTAAVRVESATREDGDGR